MCSYEINWVRVISTAPDSLLSRTFLLNCRLLLRQPVCRCLQKPTDSDLGLDKFNFDEVDLIDDRFLLLKH